MKKHVFQIIATILMVTIGVVYSLCITNEKNTTISVNLDNNIEELAEVSKDKANGVVTPPADEAVPNTIKSITGIKYYQNGTEFVTNDFYQLPLGYFNDRNFSYKVFYSDNTTKDVPLNEDNLSNFIGSSYATKVLYEAGKYTIDIKYKGASVKLKIESVTEGAKEYDVIYTYRRAEHAKRHVIYGQKLPHLIAGEIPNPVKNPGSIYTYSFTKWDYNGSGYSTYRDVTNASATPFPVIEIVGLYNCSQANRNIALKDDNYICVNDLDDPARSGYEGTTLHGIYHIGRVEGLQVWASTETVSKNTSTNITYDYAHNGAPLIDDSTKQALILSKIFTSTSNSMLDIEHAPGVINSHNYTTLNLPNEDELENNYYNHTSHGLLEYLGGDIEFSGDIILNDELDTEDPQHNEIKYVLGLFLNCHIYVRFDTTLNGSTYDHGNSYQYVLVPESHYFAVTTQATTEPDKRITIDFDKLKNVAEKAYEEVSA